MAFYIKKLSSSDESDVKKLWDSKLEVTGTDPSIFTINGSEPNYKYFLMDENIYGSETLRCHGYYQDDELLAVIGHRDIVGEPSWVLSFIVTHKKCHNSITIIKDLLTHVIKIHENLGYFQWFVISRLDKFKIWQKLFSTARNQYHHYVYARVKANTIPKWNRILSLCGSKLFPYDTNISMYISKNLCTTNEFGSTVDIDERLL